MFCTNCGKELSNDAKFCHNCGFAILDGDVNSAANPITQKENVVPTSEVTNNNQKSITSTPTNTQLPTKKKPTVIVAAIVVVACVLVAIFALSGNNNKERDKAIETVKNGYLGTYTDVTIEEFVNFVFTSTGDLNDADIVWDGGTTNNGELVVEASCTYGDDQETAIQFKMLTEETFKFNGMVDPLKTVSSLDDSVKMLNMLYYVYYLDKYDMEKAVDLLNQSSCGAVLCGAAAGYSGNREVLYQDAFHLDDLPATAANYLDLLEFSAPSIDSEDVLQEDIPFQNYAYYEELYGGVLGGYYIALADGYSASQLENYGMNYLCSYYDSSQIGYTIMDIDYNGVPELLIGEIGEYGGGSGFFFDMYTIIDETVCLVASSSERDRYYLCEDGTIANEGSSSAWSSFYSYYYIDSSTAALTPAESVIYDESFMDVGPWFYTTVDVYSASVYDGTQIAISEDEAMQILERHGYSNIIFEQIPPA